MSIYNSRRTEHKAPSGAVASGTAVRFFVRSGSPAVSLVMQRDGERTHELVQMHRVADGFEAQYTFAHAGLYFYLFLLHDQTLVMRGDFGEGTLTGDKAGAHLFQQTVYDVDYRPAQGFAGGTIYQIFPDRFNIGSGGVLGKNIKGRTFHTDLTEPPVWQPDADGRITNTDFFGGNLRGIEEKLDYLASLGVTCLYLNPIGEAHSNHRYDTADYKKVDPTLGTEQDFRQLCAAAHKIGIRIVLDGVFSHTGADSVYFNKYGNYPSVGAYQSQDSPYASWYRFGNFPDEYASWWGFDTLPEVNEEDENYLRFICGPDGVIDHWMSLGADGFRLDVADELPDEFIERLRVAVKRHGADKILIGEVWEDASNKISYGSRRGFLWGTELDAVMNYPFRTAVLDFVRSADAMRFMSSVTEQCENYPKPMLDQMMNMLSTHDTARALNALLYGEYYRAQSRAWQAGTVIGESDYLRGVEMLKLSWALQFTLPGVPCIYYGDEIGMQGFGDPFCRGFVKWDAPDENVRAALREISQFRADNRDVLADGSFEPLKNDSGTVAYLRRNEKGSVFVAVNRSEELTSVGTPDGRTTVVAPWSYVLRRLG